MGDRYDDDREFYRRQDRACEDFQSDRRYEEARRDSEREAGYDALRRGDTLGAIHGIAGVDAALSYAEAMGYGSAPDTDIGYRLKTLQFFGHAKGDDAMPELDFNSIFSRDAARYVAAVPTIENPWQAIEMDVTVTARFLKPDGSLLLDSAGSLRLLPDWKTFWMRLSCGWEDPGHWEEGLHRVEVWLDSSLLGERSFLITAS